MVEAHTSPAKQPPNPNPNAAHEPNPPAKARPEPLGTSPRTVMNDGLYDHLIGAQTELHAGDECWILLDPLGVPISIQADPPPIGTPAARGRINNTMGEVFQGLTSISGAELGPVVTPNPELRFEPSPPEAYQASLEGKPYMGHPSSGKPIMEFDENPQIRHAHEDHDTNARNRGVVEGTQQAASKTEAAAHNPNENKPKTEPKK